MTSLKNRIGGGRANALRLARYEIFQKRVKWTSLLVLDQPVHTQFLLDQRFFLESSILVLSLHDADR